MRIRIRGANDRKIRRVLILNIWQRLFTYQGPLKTRGAKINDATKRRGKKKHFLNCFYPGVGVKLEEGREKESGGEDGKTRSEGRTNLLMPR